MTRKESGGVLPYFTALHQLSGKGYPNHGPSEFHFSNITRFRTKQQLTCWYSEFDLLTAIFYSAFGG